MMIDREQVLWQRAQAMSFRWKKWAESTGRVVGSKRRKMMADAYLIIFRKHGLPDENEPVEFTIDEKEADGG